MMKERELLGDAPEAPWLSILKGMGLDLPAVPKPVAAYVPAVVHGNLIFVSGQLPLIEGRLAYRGRLGEDLDLEDGRAAARLCALNALAAAAAASPRGPGAVRGVVRVEGFVACVPGFQEQPQVINGASELYGALFPGQGHARLAVGCAALPLGAAVEVAVLFRCSDVSLPKGH